MAFCLAFLLTLQFGVIIRIIQFYLLVHTLDSAAVEPFPVALFLRLLLIGQRDLLYRHLSVDSQHAFGCGQDHVKIPSACTGVSFKAEAQKI